MIVSNAANLKVGDGFRTPGQPVPEFSDWQTQSQITLLRLRRVVDVSPDVAEEMRDKHAGKEKQANKERAERRLRAKQAEVRTLSKQIATERVDASNKVAILDEKESEMLELATELGVSHDSLELAERPAPPSERKPEPRFEKPDPQKLADHVAGMTGWDLACFAAAEFDLHEMDSNKRVEELVVELFAHVYGSELIPPKPTDEIGRELGLNQAQLEADRLKVREDLNERSVSELKAEAKELDIEVKGNKGEIIDAMVKALEEKAAREARSDDE